MPCNLGGGCSGIQNNRFARLQQFCRRLPNPDLLGVVERFFCSQRVILSSFQPADGPAMRTDNRANRGQRVQVAPDSHRGDGESLHQIGHGHLAVLVNQIQQIATALFG